MMEYPKINTLYKRQFTTLNEITGKMEFLDKGKSGNPLIFGDYSENEFENIKRWHVEEKIDGTNIRIFVSCDNEKCFDLRFGGRTSNAQIPCHLLDYLQKIFTKEKMFELFPNTLNVILFGEGYGSKIQACGGNYRNGPGFMLFDVYVNGWWLKKSHSESIAEKLQIPFPPFLGYHDEKSIVDLVKSFPNSRCSDIDQVMEGVICRSEPLMLFRNGKPIIFKLKCKDFYSKGMS